MSVIIKDDIGYSTRSKAAFLLNGSDAPAKKFSTPKEKSQDSSEYAYWGTNNDLPLKMAKDLQECGVLNAAADAKPRIAVGKGIQPYLLLNIDKDGKEDLEWVSDSEILDFLEDNDHFGFSIDGTYNACAYGWRGTQYLRNRKGDKINRIKNIDIVKARLEKMDRNGFINNIFLCDDWEQIGSVTNNEYIKKIALLEEGSEYLDLLERSESEFATIHRNLRNGRSYYPDALWYSAKAWVDIAKSIPRMKNAMFTNQMTIKYLVTISASYWTRIHKQWNNFTTKQRQEIMDKKLDEIDTYLTGTDNSYKSMFSNSYVDPVTKQEIADIKIDVLDDKVKDGKMIPDSAAANSEILFAFCVNPALTGAGQPGGAYANNAGGSNIREAYLTQIMLMERERKENLKPFNIVKRFNGWDKRLEVERNVFAATPSGNTSTVSAKKMKPRLVFRYQSGVLTTLDTGKSTKPEVV